MISSQGTQVQRWSKSLAISTLVLLLAAHLALVLVAVLLCPELYVVERFQGGHCQSVSTDSDEATIVDNQCEDCTGGGAKTDSVRCVSRGDGETVRLTDILMSFRFPRQPDLSVWSWRSTASLSLHIKILDDDLILTAKESFDYEGRPPNVSQFVVGGQQFEQLVQLSGSLDYALSEYLGQDTGPASVDITASAWHSRAIVRRVNRTLFCRHVNLLAATAGQSADPLEAPDAAKRELNFVCVVHPLFELAPLTNATYIASLHLEARESKKEVDSGYNSTLDQSSEDYDWRPAGFIDLIHSNATIVSYLTVITDTEAFHEMRFYIKCLFTPLVLLALVWFMVRLCVHDLYVSIPDRLLITAALAQLVVNLPIELILAHLPIAHLILIEPIGEALLFTSLALFWLVFTLDKLADNEPWERNTRYYWRSIGLLVCLAGLALLGVGYLDVPSFANPFQNHWQPGNPTWVGLGLIFGLAVGVAAYQSYLSLIIFRVICDISVHYPTRRRAWRLKGVLLYSMASSLLLCLSRIIRQLLTLCLHWNPEVDTDPLPFSITAGGVLLVVELAAINLHIVFLLLALSRSPEPAEGWYTPVRPVMYSPVHREEQLHLWDLSAHPSPLLKIDS